MTVTIIGAGLAGLLAGNMLRHRAVIFEKQERLPNNHHALLRFKTGVFGTAIGIPFKKVRMVKAVFGDNSNPIANELNYSKKVIGQYRSDRSLPVGVVKDDRFIAPSDIISQMASCCDIKYGCDFAIASDLFGNSIAREGDPIISTIPMPSLMELLNYPYKEKVQFSSIPGVVITAQILNCDAYATYYFPNPQHSIYRASITGSQFIIEMTGNHASKFEVDHQLADTTVKYYAKLFGLEHDIVTNTKVKMMKYSKILPIDDDIRKDFMHWATNNFNIYSLGRYATWRPGLLLDDLVQDVSLISRWALKGGRYGAFRHWA